MKAESGNHPMLLITAVLLLFKFENEKELHEEINKSQWSTLRSYWTGNIPGLIKCVNPLIYFVIQTFLSNSIC